MHKGVILLVKANSVATAIRAANGFLANYDSETSANGVFDWYQVGGRWTGTLVPGYNVDDDSANQERCDLCNGTGFRTDDVGKKMREEEPTYTCNGCGEYDTDAKKWRHSKLGPGVRIQWPTQWKLVPEREARPLTDEAALGVVREWAANWKQERLTEALALKGKFAGDKMMEEYSQKLADSIEADEFSFESNVFDTVAGKNAVPADISGYWAVMIDMHN